jgi:hypothetical protein
MHDQDGSSQSINIHCIFLNTKAFPAHPKPGHSHKHPRRSLLMSLNPLHCSLSAAITQLSNLNTTLQQQRTDRESERKKENNKSHFVHPKVPVNVSSNNKRRRSSLASVTQTRCSRSIRRREANTQRSLARVE